MEKQGIIRMVEYRKTPNGQKEKRYAIKEFYDNLMADLDIDVERFQMGGQKT